MTRLLVCDAPYPDGMSAADLIAGLNGKADFPVVVRNARNEHKKVIDVEMGFDGEGVPIEVVLHIDE